MIPLVLASRAESMAPYVARLRIAAAQMDGPADVLLVREDDDSCLFAGESGLLEIRGASSASLDGDIVLVEPMAGRIERLIRSTSPHNTYLVTERCDQLCVMCSQPPKKTHLDRFSAFREASLLAPRDMIVGISGGEPTLYKAELLHLIETVLAQRPDLEFHVLTNGQHFDDADIERLRHPLYRRVRWGIPVYAQEPALHDRIVGKPGAFVRLERSLAALLRAGASVELRTVVLTENVDALPTLAQYVSSRLNFAAAWSIMQLENIGFARNRWSGLYFDHRRRFEPIAAALDHALLFGIDARLLNFARCTVPSGYRHLAAPSISDWKRRYAPACGDCREKGKCSGFFEWHPDSFEKGVTPL
jgi:His-Xaa-Ser system radical SAM maturase HxsC